ESSPKRVPRRDEGIGYYRAAIAARPLYANTYYALGAALNDKKDWVGAEAALRTALRLNPEPTDTHHLPDTHNLLAAALAGQGRNGEALRVMRAALAGNPAWATFPLNGVRYDAACYAARCVTG